MYLRDLRTGSMRRIVRSDAAGGFGHSALSGDGEHIAYLYATFAPGNNRNIVMHFDAEAHVYRRSVQHRQHQHASFVAQGMSISGNGRYISFPVRSPSMFGGSTATQVLAIDRDNPGNIIIASADANAVGDGHSVYPQVSDDGHVLFLTNAGNLTGNFANGVQPTIVIRDLHSSALAIASRRANGTPVSDRPWLRLPRHIERWHCCRIHWRRNRCVGQRHA
jgi:Tol biopolymer transport system component